jgi:hypothetical protein
MMKGKLYTARVLPMNSQRQLQATMPIMGSYFDTFTTNTNLSVLPISKHALYLKRFTHHAA